MPYTSKPGNRAASPSQTTRAVNRVKADQGSADSDQHTKGEIKVPCLECGALINERCAAERYPSGKIRVYYPGGFHRSRGRQVKKGTVNA